MIAVSAAFSAAEIADIAQIAAKVFIYRGNYAGQAFGATATASDTDASGYYPAAGANNGDRTEINIGAPSVADNGVGLASWRGANTPSGGSPSWLQIAFGTSRTFNYVKLYNLSTDPLTAYTLQWSTNGSSWTTFATYAAANRSNGGLDVYDFSGAGTTFTATYVRVLITGSTSGAANVVAIEVYNKYDVTSRATSIKTDRQRDWKQVNPMAATCDLTFDNSDRFFSPFHNPTAAELACGFFPWNAGAQPLPRTELDVGLKVQVQTGFYYSATPYFNMGWGAGGFGSIPWDGSAPGVVSGPELVNSFVGTIDAPKPNSRARTCQITGRDGMKDAINQTWSTRLKQNIDVGAAVQYMLNICNVSNYEMNVAMTGIVIPYFFAYEQTAYDVIQDLVQAAGAAQYWVDENGIHQFANLLAESDDSHTDFTWVSQEIAGFAITYNSGAGTLTNNGQLVAVYGGGSGKACVAAIPISGNSVWQFTLSNIASTTVSGTGDLIFFAATNNGATGSLTGYALRIMNDGGNSSVYVQILRYDNVAYPFNASANVTSSYNLSYAAANGQYTIVRDPSGNFTIWVNSVMSTATGGDTTYSSFTDFLVVATDVSTFYISNINQLNPQLGVLFCSSSVGSMEIQGPVIDQTAAVSAEGNLAAGFAPANAAVTYSVATSPDGVTFGTYGAVTLNAYTQQGPITATTRRYIRYIVGMTVGTAIPLWAPYYTTINWELSGASSSVRTLSYDSSVCDITLQISDSLGGDSSVLNYFEVISSPTVLTGTTADVQWTATVGQPVTPVSATNPLVVNTGTIQIQAVVEGGMDVTYMGASATVAAGSSGGAAGTTAFLVTMGTAAGTVSISYVHPTKPIITLTITTAGTITNLQLIGQAFSSASNPIDVIAPPLALGLSASQQAYERRTQQIQNNYIPNPAVAQLIANTQLLLYQYPAIVLPDVELTLTPSVQLTDLAQLTDVNQDLSAAQTWNLSGISHEITKSPGEGAEATIKTTVTAVILPA